MIDLLQAAQTAVYRKLAADEALVALGAVHQHVPENAQPPMTIIGNLESEPTGGKGEQCERITVEVIALYRGAGRAPLLDIMHAQRVALDGQELLAGDVAFDTPRFLGAVADGPAQDGVTYAGISTFSIECEPA